MASPMFESLPVLRTGSGASCLEVPLEGFEVVA